MPDSIVQVFLSSHLRFEMGFPEDSELSLFQWAMGKRAHSPYSLTLKPQTHSMLFSDHGHVSHACTDIFQMHAGPD